MKHWLLIGLLIITIAACQKQSSEPTPPQQLGGIFDTIIPFDPVFPIAGNWVLKTSVYDTQNISWPQDLIDTIKQTGGSFIFYSWASHLILFNDNEVLLSCSGIDLMPECQFSGTYNYDKDQLSMPFSVTINQTASIYKVVDLTPDTLILDDQASSPTNYIYTRKK